MPLWKEKEAQEDKEAQAEEATQEDAPQEVGWIAKQQIDQKYHYFLRTKFL